MDIYEDQTVHFRRAAAAATNSTHPEALGIVLGEHFEQLLAAADLHQASRPQAAAYTFVNNPSCHGCGA